MQKRRISVGETYSIISEEWAEDHSGFGLM